MTRTVLTYEEVANLTGLPNNCRNVLGHVYCYCAQNSLPLLPILVVEKHSGKPSSDVYDGLDIPEEHRRCFRYDWLACRVRSPQELDDAYRVPRGLRVRLEYRHAFADRRHPRRATSNRAVGCAVPARLRISY